MHLERGRISPLTYFTVNNDQLCSRPRAGPWRLKNKENLALSLRRSQSNGERPHYPQVSQQTCLVVLSSVGFALCPGVPAGKGRHGSQQEPAVRGQALVVTLCEVQVQTGRRLWATDVFTGWAIQRGLLQSHTRTSGISIYGSDNTRLALRKIYFQSFFFSLHFPTL